MNTIIAVSGVANSGKSSSLLSLINSLKNHGWHETDLTPNKNALNKVILFTRNQHTIGINLAGDGKMEIAFGLNLLLNAKASIIICACHPGYVSSIMNAASTGMIGSYSIAPLISQYNLIETSIYSVRCNQSIGQPGRPVRRMSLRRRNKSLLPNVTLGMTTSGLDLNDIWAEQMTHLIYNLL